MRLWHYTCEHAAAHIETDGVLYPTPWRSVDRMLRDAGLPSPGLAGGGVVWLTDLEVPDKAALGLQSVLSPCDRTEARFAVDTERAQPWLTWRLLRLPRRAWVQLIERPPHDPSHWWVHGGPVAAVRA